ncbi:unnamed protein product [Calypogeia fissa]
MCFESTQLHQAAYKCFKQRRHSAEQTIGATIEASKLPALPVCAGDGAGAAKGLVAADTKLPLPIITNITVTTNTALLLVMVNAIALESPRNSIPKERNRKPVLRVLQKNSKLPFSILSFELQVELL